MFSAFNPSKCTHLGQWAADCAAPGEQSWTSCRSRDSNPQLWVTSGFKSNALSIRPTTAHCMVQYGSLLGGFPLGTVPGTCTLLVPPRPGFQAIRTVTKT